MTDAGAPPMRESFGNQSVWGTKGEHITIAWYGSTESIERVAAWYRATLAGHAEEEPRRWTKRETKGEVRSFHNVLVGAAEDWPAKWPKPPPAPAHLLTFIMEATGLSAAAPG